jgi:hypothetical protein
MNSTKGARRFSGARGSKFFDAHYHNCILTTNSHALRSVLVCMPHHSLQCLAAVGEQRLAGDPAAEWRGEEHDDPCDLLRRAEATKRDTRLCVLT